MTSDYASAGSGPASFDAGTSGLTYSFTSLANTGDNIDVSNDDGTSWTYAPSQVLHVKSLRTRCIEIHGDLS